MKIKIGNFNFISKDSDSLYLNSYEFNDKLDNFYMDGKEDTLYVRDRSNFDKAYEKNLTFEKELLENHYVIDYTMLIRNKINQFIKHKAMSLYRNKSFSGYELYSDLEISDIIDYENKVKCSFSYSTKITPTNKLVYETDTGKQIIFNPYTENIENLEELYKIGFFDRYINSYLILLEIENKTAPDFVYEILNINNFLKNKQTVNVIFKDGEKTKVDAKINNILEIHKYKVIFRIDYQNYKLDDLKSIGFNRNELNINLESLKDFPSQIAYTAKDFLMFKIDKMKEDLKYDFINYQRKMYREIPSNIEDCISIVLELKEADNGSIKIEYPKWFSDEFIELWKQHDMIKELENANCIEDIKEVAIETGDNELQRIYYMFEGEEMEDEDLQEESEEM